MPSSSAVPGAAVAACRPLARFAVAAIASLLIAPAAAADPPLSFAETLRIAVERSPQLESQRAMVDAAREMAGPAGELPDPKLKLGVENVPTNGADSWSLTRDFMTMTKIGVMQEFPREEKRKLRSQRAENDAQRGAVALESTRLAVMRETATAWLARWYRGRGGTPDRAPDRRGRARGHDRRSGVSRRAGRRRATSSMRRAR